MSQNTLEVSKETVKKVISDLRDLFNCGNFKEKLSFEQDGSFYIHKSHFSRDEVIAKIENYFFENSKTGCAVDLQGTTFLNTRFRVFDL